MESCEEKHTWKDIYREKFLGFDSVVRWCSKCGAIRTDKQVKDKIYEGYFSTIMYPAVKDKWDKVY